MTTDTLVKSLSITNMLNQRSAVVDRLQQALTLIFEAELLANAAHVGFPRIVIAEGEIPPLTQENIQATFHMLYESRGDMFERGVIQCFRRLSWDYKTNEPCKFGRRIIMNALFTYGSPNHNVTN